MRHEIDIMIPSHRTCGDTNDLVATRQKWRRSVSAHRLAVWREASRRLGAVSEIGNRRVDEVVGASPGVA